MSGRYALQIGDVMVAVSQGYSLIRKGEKINLHLLGKRGTMKRPVKLWAWLFILFIFFGCSEEKNGTVVSHKVGGAAMAPREAMHFSSTGPANKNLTLVERKIIRNGELAFECSNLGETRKRVEEAIKKYGGYISNENEYRYTDRIEQSIIIRVPAENFDGLVADISQGVRRFDRKHIGSTDVTEEFLDIELRIKIKKETETRYRELLARAKNVKEILEIERELGKIREEIESVEGRLKYLQNQVAFSTLTVTFYEVISTPVAFFSKAKTGLKTGWNNFILFLVGVVSIWPFIVLFIGIIFVIRRLWKTKKQGKSSK
ncbi:MAG: DUF4349 domain-containing protein [Deltaproteobacteria bacterium]|nr:DUF4349 domain-containing protein [Deltaproteobacteria bacterium]